MGFRCAACTWQNKDSATACEMCGTKKPQPPVVAPLTQWTCPACTVVNRMLDAACATCATKRPALNVLSEQNAVVGSRHLGTREPLLLLDATGSMNLPLKDGGPSRLVVVRDALRVVCETYAFDRTRPDGVGVRVVSFAGGQSADVGYVNSANIADKFSAIEASGSALMQPGWAQIQAVAPKLQAAGAKCQPLVVLAVTDSLPRDMDALVKEFETHAKGQHQPKLPPLVWSILLIGDGDEFDAAKRMYGHLAQRFPWVRCHALGGRDVDAKAIGAAMLSAIDTAYVVDQKERSNTAAKPAEAKSPGGAVGGGGGAGQQKLPDWACQVCTLTNPASTLKCSACGTARGVASPHPSSDINLALGAGQPPILANAPSDVSLLPAAPGGMAPPVAVAAALPAVAAAANVPKMFFMQMIAQPNGQVAATPMYVTLGVDGKPNSAPRAVPADMLTPQLLQQLVASMNLNGAGGGQQPMQPVQAVAVEAVPYGAAQPVAALPYGAQPVQAVEALPYGAQQPVAAAAAVPYGAPQPVTVLPGAGAVPVVGAVPVAAAAPVVSPAAALPDQLSLDPPPPAYQEH